MAGVDSSEPTAAADTGDKKLKLNIDELLDRGCYDDPEENVTFSSDKKRRHSSPEKSPDTDLTLEAEFADKSDSELKAQMERITKQVRELSHKLKDNGEKLKHKLQRATAEYERRQRRPSPQVTHEPKKKSVHSEYSRSNGVLDGPNQATPLAQPVQMSQFCSSFLKKIKNNSEIDSEQHTSDKAENAFCRELPCLNHCDKRRRKEGGMASLGRRANASLSSNELYEYKHNNGSSTRGKYGRLNGFLPSKAPSQDKELSSFTRMDCSKSLSSNSSKNEKEPETVVLVDEEEPELNKRKQDIEELPSTMNEGKIYYPSREAQESLEIFRCELKCLEPGECLTSTIMNFYIRYLQEMCSSASRLQQNYYFFNTYFYSKLQEAVSRQKSEKEAFLIKFRRWWKGVNLFQKAYIFLPINEDNHWSLVIVCMPDEEDSGPFTLHLDSLGLHCSTTIFANIKSLLKSEWEYMCRDAKGVDSPFPDRIWRFLPRRIYERTIPVPRQTNDYDCGLFVLFYMERFIEDAPKRLKKEDLSMFGKNWFKPLEASSLRGKLKRILHGEFHKALRENNSSWEPVLLSVDAKTATDADRPDIS